MQKIHIILLLAMCLTIICCQSKNTNKNTPEKEKANEIEPIDSTKNQIYINDKQEICYTNCHEIKQNDTLNINDYIIYFNPASQVYFEDYYKDKKNRDSIATLYSNSYEKARAIEDYLYPNSNNLFARNDSTLTINLKNGKKLVFPPESGCVFEYYFEDIDYVLLMRQHFEGFSYMLVNLKNGIKTNISGHPYFSPDNTSFITAGVDLQARYNFNGLCYYEIKNDSIIEKFEIEIKNWGPQNIKWISKNSIYIKQTHVDFSSDYNDDFIFYDKYSKMTFIETP